MGGCEEEKPYTPFQVATSLPTEPGVPAPKTKENMPSPHRADGRQAPSSKNKWKWGARELKAPRGLVFSSGIEVSINDAPRILAWLVPETKEKKPVRVEPGLYRFDEKGQPDELLQPLSTRLPSGADCRYTTHLKSTGQQTLTSIARAQCKESSLPDTPEQSLTILRPQDGKKIFELFFSSPSPGESISTEVNSSDRDGDGLDDIELVVSLTAPGGSSEKLPLRFLSRTAGPSRQADAPLADLARRVSQLSTWSVQKAHRQKVPAQVNALRRLLTSLCEELGTPKLSLENGTKLSCGNIWPQLTRLAHASIQAHVGLKNLPAALGEIARAEWFTHKLDEKELKAMAQLVMGDLKAKKARQLARFDVKLKEEPTPHKSQLFFTQDAQLFAQLQDGKTKRLTMRGDPPLNRPDPEDKANSTEGSSYLPQWELIPQGPGGHYLVAAVPSCERSELQLAFGRKSGAPLPSVPLPLLAPRPGNCRKYAGLQLTPEVLKWQGGQLALILGGQLIWSNGKERDLEEPVAWGSELGLILRDGSELIRLDLPDAHRLHHCQVAANKKKIACVKGPSVFVYEPQ